MASILKVDTITGVSTAGSIAVTGEGNSTTTNLQQGLAKVWINFDGEAEIRPGDRVEPLPAPPFCFFELLGDLMHSAP